MTIMDAFFATCSTLFAAINGEVLFISLFLAAAGYMFWKWNKNPDADFDALNLFKTNNFEDIYKVGYAIGFGIVMWCFVLVTKNKNLDVWMLLVFCGFVLGPPVFNNVLKAISGRGKGPDDDRKKKDDDCDDDKDGHGHGHGDGPGGPGGPGGRR